MAKTDEALGLKVKAHLESLGLETVMQVPKMGRAHEKLEQGIHGFLTNMGLDVSDPSIRATPERVADMFVDELCAGLNYGNFPKATVVPNTMNYDELVTVEKIRTISLCEHHLATIYGYTHIAYIPKNQVLGLSKFARITEFFARRPQIQERLTAQIYHALAYILDTDDVAVVQKCDHFCMKARGALQHDAATTTSKLGGRFKTNPALRKELFDAVSL